MKRRDDNPETLARERMITDSLDAFARVRVTVSVENRVMARLRTHAATEARRAPLNRRQKAALGATAAVAGLGEVVFWAAVVLVVAQIPGLSLLREALGWMPDISRTCLTLAAAGADVARGVSAAALVVLNGLAILLPSPMVLAASFVFAVSSTTFIAVRRDLQRSPAARGLR